LVSLVVGAIGALALTNGRQADWSSASDRNSELALGIAEAGVHQTVAKMQAQAAQGTFPSVGAFSGSTQLGSFGGTTYRCAPGSLPEPCLDMDVDEGFVIESRASSGGQVLERAREVRVAIEPPLLYTDGGKYALFSKTSIELKNNDHIFAGDVWANENVILENNAIHYGSITAARGWIRTESGAEVRGNLISGHYNAAGWAIDIGGSVGGFVRASVTAPGCTGETASNYNVRGGTITGNVTTFGVLQSGTAGSRTESTCTQAPAQKPLPEFIWRPNLYTPAPISKTRTEFNSYPGPFKGTFYVWETNPALITQGNRLDLSGWHISGDVTIYTNLPIYTADIDDNALPSGETAKLELVTTYKPPTGSNCDVNHDGSDCSVHAKNHLDPACRTKVLIHAANGPAAIKNNSKMCGSVMSDGIFIKNNQDLTYEGEFDRTLGFGPNAFEIGRWEEIPAG
jgi:hypothetical protein